MRQRVQRAAARSVLAVLLASSVACGDDPTVPGDGVTGDVLVSAAASLTDAFGDVEDAFETMYPGVDVLINLAGSSTLREQILGGAPADVFASANMTVMDQVAGIAGVASDPEVFAGNLLQIAVPKGNPAGITGLEDFADDSLFLGLCAPLVPCGEFARQALANAGVTPAIDTNEPDVRSLLTKVAEGELDAAITYATDITASGAVEGIGIPANLNVAVRHPIAVLADAPNPEGGAAFVEFVLSADGKAILSAWGFASP